ncbi:MAG TPA: L,D-transpeptidase family protein [Gaiellaceae bacterium]|nr:L,D-transpeptidase family protein [Gaiellaceae bacterium]
MRRVAAAAAFLSLAAAGLLTASVLAGPGPLSSSTDSTTTETTSTVTTTSTTPVTPPPPAAKPKPKPKPKPKLPARLARRVQIGGVHVGGLTPRAALTAVRLAARSPLVVTVAGARVTVSPSGLGVKTYAEEAVARARRARAGARVPLTVTVRGPAVRAWVARLARNRDRAVRDARVVLEGTKPRVMPERDGYLIRREATVAAVVEALLANRRGPVKAVASLERPSVREAFFDAAVIIRRGTKRLQYFKDKGGGLELFRSFTVATGQSSYPTPLGSFEIVQMWRNPWWYPPPSPWAQGLKPVPPGPGNPLGTRWMGLNVSAVGIHGTPDAASLGYSASHGCIRMAIPSAEWLFNNVKIGTPVFIVNA